MASLRQRKAFRAGGFAVLQVPAQAVPERSAVPEKPSATHRVTLITGDVVTVTTLADGRQTADVDRPARA